MTENTDTTDIEEQITNQFAEDRFEKRCSLRESDSSNPYPNLGEPDMQIEAYRSEYGSLSEEELESISDRVTLAGRVTRVNDLNGIAFLDIEDETGDVQIIFHNEETEEFDRIGMIDTADILYVTGVPHRTDTDEFSLLATSYVLGAKTLHHPPDEDGLSERDRIRNRTAALWNDDLYNSVRTRFEMTRYLRQNLEDRGFLEVETPILHNEASGASAQPFETYSNAIDREMALRIAPELYLKRLVAGGFDRIFEIGRVFRNEDIDTTHNPEFTMLELYQAYADYETMMNLTEELVSDTIYEFTGDYTLEYDGVSLDFTPPWPRVSLEDSFEEYANLDVESQETSELREIAQEVCSETTDVAEMDREALYMELYDELVEDEITGPVFIIDQPASSTPLCKRHEDSTTQLERFEAVVAGVELANAYSELNDPIQQAQSFKSQQGIDAVDFEYVNALGYGLPPTGGLGIGIDRLAMFLTNNQSIKDVLAFPMVRPE